MPRICVVVPAFNAAEWLGPTLQSVVTGTFRDVDVVVVDDGSSDITAEVAQSFGPPVRVLRQSNRGMSASRNRGIEASDAEFIALLDADDVWHPRKLELQIEVMDAMPEVGLCFSEFFSWNGNSPPGFDTSVDRSLDARLSGWIYHQMILTNFVLPSSAFLRRSAVQRLGPFLCDNQQTDDWEYFVRASRTFPVAKLASPLVAYRQTSGSLSKRPSPRNVTEEMREALIARYGLSSEHGVPVDVDELARRRYKGRRDFGDRHVAVGDLVLGLTELSMLLKTGPRRLETALTLFKAGGRRLLRRAG
jgi:glycosyltransferase involved in cell wall biosynthesis